MKAGLALILVHATKTLAMPEPHNTHFHFASINDDNDDKETQVIFKFMMNSDWNSGWNSDWNSGWNSDWNSDWSSLSKRKTVRSF